MITIEKKKWRVEIQKGHTTKIKHGSPRGVEIQTGRAVYILRGRISLDTDSEIGGAVDVVSNVATSTILGRTTAGSGDSEELSPSATRTLLNVEDGATADQTGAQIKTAYEAEANAFTDTKNTKLSGIESGADVTDATNVTASGALMDSEVTNLAEVKAFDSTDYAAALGADDNYVTDAEKTVIGNTSGTNSGDQDLSGKADLASPTFTGTVAGITATMVGLGNVDNTSNATERDAVATLENKRIQPRVSSSASGNITPTKVDFDRYIRTGLSADITISNPTMDIGEVVAIQLSANGVGRAITFGTHYKGLEGLPLPTATKDLGVMSMVLEKVTATKVLVSYVEEA